MPGADEKEAPKKYHKQALAIFVSNPYTAKDLKFYQDKMKSDYGVDPEEYTMMWTDDKHCDHVKEGKSIFDLPNPNDVESINAL